LTFILVAVVFFVYDMYVQRRNMIMINNAARSNAIVTSMFPAQIRERLLLQQQQENKKNMDKNRELDDTFDDGDENDNDYKKHQHFGIGRGSGGSGALADLFLDCTVMFADITGFTAWSSVREPSQVFQLLEAVFSTFDRIAKKRRIFKVETVGDCYVAVAGLPDPRPDHAVVLCRFASVIMGEMKSLAERLETTLGPDTGDLSLRIGLHSGPVTGGVLRGERARFQLFGDTMNTAARMESTGKQGCIQVSTETAKQLVSYGKGAWLEKRSDNVSAKGKGDLETYWLVIAKDKHEMAYVRSVGTASTIQDDMSVKNQQFSQFDERLMRLIDWNVDTLARLLKLVVARRDSMSTQSYGGDKKSNGSSRRYNADEVGVGENQCFLDEVCEIIQLPEFDAKAVHLQRINDQDSLDAEVISELRDYITCVAQMYRQNPFHNFEHASHVLMSVVKLMSRIIAPADLDLKGTSNHAEVSASLHDHTYGITSDPLTQFACAFSALIHDVDHSGVPNVQLIEENAHLAKVYKFRSVAEQNSLDLSWRLLMDNRYKRLQGAIFGSDAEMRHFRQLLINSVMATDIVDKDLKTARNNRWEKAFSEAYVESKADATNRKATIVIEHLIQASDVCHTMQHWHVYRKWNECFFEENYKAYIDGRSQRDPSEYWYDGEIGFLDFYVIPLAKKLKDCGVFGKSSDEYLNYAVLNRQEWENKGKEVVAELLNKSQMKFGVRGGKGFD
jgi:class 3 adenylate cyclase